MEKKEILDGNKLIAEFMGGTTEQKEIYTGLIEDCSNVNHMTDWGASSIKNQVWIPIRKLKYHTLWDWLMPVCQKINSKDCQVTAEMNGIKDSIMPYVNAMRKMKDGAIRFDLEKTWQGVVAFIKWYNTTKTPTP